MTNGLSWSRGLFRLWLVLSLAWAALITIEDDPIKRIAYDESRPQRFVFEGQEYQFPGFGFANDDAGEDFLRRAFQRTKDAGTFFGDPAAAAKAGRVKLHPTRMARWLEFGTTLFAPPFTVLAAFFVLRWIARGFKPRAPA